jgi:hypothetical protein
MAVIPQAVRRGLKGVLRRWESARAGLRTWDFPEWNSTLDDALKALPELENCPHEVYRALAVPRGDVSKLTVLVCERDAPVAVVVLRSADDVWEPVTTWITPGRPFPSARPDILPVLHAVAMPMRLAWWRCTDDPPRSRRVAPGAPESTYRLPCDADAELLWHESGLLPDVRKARRKCERFRVSIDAADGSEWVIRNWGLKWRVPAHHVEDVVMAARALERLGRYHNLVVYDEDRRIGGISQIDDNGDLVGQAAYRDASYNRYSLGTFMFDRHFAWAVASGFKGVDFGGTVQYKQRWAPVGGRKFVVSVTPLYQAIAAAVRSPWSRSRRQPGVRPGDAAGVAQAEGGQES